MAALGATGGGAGAAGAAVAAGGAAPLDAAATGGASLIIRENGARRVQNSRQLVAQCRLDQVTGSSFDHPEFASRMRARLSEQVQLPRELVGEVGVSCFLGAPELGVLDPEGQVRLDEPVPRGLDLRSPRLHAAHDGVCLGEEVVEAVARRREQRIKMQLSLPSTRQEDSKKGVTRKKAMFNPIFMIIS